MDATVADARMQGENAYDFLGRSLAVVDADGDAQGDVVVGATGWPADQYRGSPAPPGCRRLPG